MIIKRIKNIWNLSRFKPVNKDGDHMAPGIILEEDISVGDGKAEFFGEGTEEDWVEQQKEDEGTKGLFGTGR